MRNLRTLALLLSLLACTLAGPGWAEIAGPAEVSDGDTLKIGETTVRLFGIDAPELAQTCTRADGTAWPCGEEAAARLVRLTAGRTVACAPVERDRYGRMVATCAARGADLGAVLIREGLAWAYVRYSLDYVAAEAEAQADARGLWQGSAEVAWDYRRRAGGFRPASGTATAAPDGCLIKGNINSGGERIYHTPASPWYARTRVNEARGQRWFCTEAEARAAGWRAARW